MSSDTKSCRHCRQPIAVGARLCQHCHGYQSWFANYRDPRYTLIWPVLFVLVMSGWIYAMQRSFSVDSGSGEAPRVEVFEVETRVTQSREGDRIFVLGNVHNTSAGDAAGIVFRVNILDANDKVVDTFLASETGLIVPGNGSSKFRVSGLVSVPGANVKRADVTVERTKTRRKWD